MTLAPLSATSTRHMYLFDFKNNLPFFLGNISLYFSLRSEGKVFAVILLRRNYSEDVKIFVKNAQLIDRLYFLTVNEIYRHFNVIHGQLSFQSGQ